MRYFILLLFFIPISLFSQSIQGPQSTCKNDCAMYTMQSTSSGPFVWNVSGIDSENLVGESVEICWTDIGDQTIAVTDVSAVPGQHLTTLNVSVNENQGPEIIFPLYPTCESRDSLVEDVGQELPPIICETVCGGSTVSYDISNPSGSYSWDIEGASNTAISGSNATITWNEMGAGYISISNTDDNMCTAETSHCIEILEVPEASAILSSNSICLGQTITLTSNTADVVDYFWESGDSQFSTGSQTTFTYENTGSYTGSLVVQTECFCYDTTYFTVEVNVNPGPEILCTGTICALDTTTYYAADICSSYSWNISANGTVVDGGSNVDDFVEVVWQNGPAGEIMLSTPGCGTSCAIPTTESIPIISNNVSIEGPQVVCKGTQSVYRAPRFGGTEYNWNITGPGSITSGWGTEEIVVEWQNSWDTPSMAVIELQYENCFLECGGNAILNIELKDPVEISGTGDICLDNNNNYIAVFYQWNSVNADWEVQGPDGSIVFTSTNEDQLDYDFSDGPGIYRIQASVDPNLYCDPVQVVYVPLDPLPEITVDILGDLVFCPGEVVSYTLPIDENKYRVRWIVEDGAAVSNFNSYSITRVWASAGPYSVTAEISDINSWCFGEGVTIYPEAATSSEVTGATIACLDTREIYNVAGLTDESPNWEIIPNDAGSLRTLPDGSVEVHWHSSGTHSISAGFCATSIGLTVDVLAETPVVVTAPDGVCPDEQAAISIILPGGASIEIKDESMATISNSNTTTLGAGFYLVELTDINGCISQETFEIEEYIVPEIRISTPDDTGFCPSDGDSGPTLYALNTLSGYTYEWYRDGVALGITANSMSSSIYGFYYVVATNADGCTSISNEIELFEYCGPNGRCNGRCSNYPPCQDGTYVSFTANNTGFCNEYSFTNTSADFVSGTILYDFADVDAGADSISVLENPDHTFTHAGHYLVTMIAEVTANVNPPFCWDYVDIIVPVAANFTAIEGCAGDGISFTQEATFVTGYSVSSYSWDFGDPSSGASNTSTDADPMHTYSSAGMYTVNLLITANTGCQARISKEVIVKGGPNVDFNIPTIQCQDTAIPFDALVDAEAISVEWSFGDMASGAANVSKLENALHTFSNSQIYSVTLSATNIYGCTNTVSKNIDISNSVLAGDIGIMPNSPICKGDSATLTAPSGGLTYLWSDGTIGQTRKVGDDDKYSVTITDTGGCQYSPDDVQIAFHDTPDLQINGFVYYTNFESEAFYDYLEVCQGIAFNLRVPYQFGLEYEWTLNNNTGTNLQWWAGLSNLAPGTHEIGVTVTDPANGCIYEIDPVTIVIHPRPDSPIVLTDQSSDCEDLTHTLSISNYDPTSTYYWSNGAQGESITVSQAGLYEVRVISEYGCETWPGGYTIQAKPRKDIFPHGCQEVCFPDTICLPDNLGYSYQWMKDGVSLSNNTSWQELTEPGEYEVIMTHYSGCSETSEILNIEPKSADHKINGIVFLDDNEDGIYDAGDLLLENALVQLLDGATVIETMLTNVNGEYQFDQLGITNPSIQVDVSSLGYNIPVPTKKEDVEFTKCIEEKEENFPFTDQCIRLETTLDLNTCAGEPIVYETITVQPGETDSIIYSTLSGCDSTLIINAIELPQAQIVLDVIPACDTTTGGSLSLSSSMSGTTYSIDNTSSFAPTVDYNNLTPGLHNLWVLDQNGCPQTIPFNIDLVAEPMLDISTITTCANELEGSAIIAILDGEDYEFSLDGISFSNSVEMNQLESGNHLLYVTSALGCIWDMPFTIDQYDEPILSMIPSASCTGTDNGSLTVNNLSGGNMIYTLDGSQVSNDGNYSDLASGTHTISVSDENGCEYTYSFVVEEEELPIVEINGLDICPGESNGEISLVAPNGSDYSYSLDNITYQTTPTFDGLPAGNYDIYISNANGCTNTQSIQLTEIPTPMVIITTDNACIGVANGAAQFASTESGFQYSIDGTTFSNTPNVEDLEAGVYTLFVLGTDVCLHQYPFEILEAPELDINFTDPEIDCSMSTISLEPEVITAAGDATYSWSDGTSASSNLITTDGNYSVEVADDCSVNYYEWNIDFVETEASNFYAPNIFSPNGDGINDEFLPVYKDPTQISNYSLDVFDRWGNHVYHSDVLDQGWDGKFATQAGRTGVYVWMIRAQGNFCDEVKEFELTGDVTVVR